MNYGLVLKHLYPNIDLLKDCELQCDDGETVYIKSWSYKEAGQPSESELNEAWKIVELLFAKSKKSDEFVHNYLEAVFGGFKSDALGVAYHYDSGQDDMQNLMHAVNLNEDVKYPIREDNTSKLIPHTRDDLRKVFQDASRAKLAHLHKAHALKEKLAAAQCVDEVNSLSW